MSAHIPKISLLTTYKLFVLNKPAWKIPVSGLPCIYIAYRRNIMRKRTWTWIITYKAFLYKTDTFYKVVNGLTPKYLFHIIPVTNNYRYNARSKTKLDVNSFFSRTKGFENDIVYALLYGSNSYSFDVNSNILSLTIDFRKSTKVSIIHSCELYMKVLAINIYF